ncbi:unnamed protein product [Cuscuta campestris]|uniref:Uncharacterized protein n=1 Tax=Cuscuta campestris TaxID=132261 RepID=A0A484KCQ7_9ASTE|nr:unnamed protein product [Cuscuta campestris]
MQRRGLREFDNFGKTNMVTIVGGNTRFEVYDLPNFRVFSSIVGKNGRLWLQYSRGKSIGEEKAKTHSGDESVIDRSVTWVLARKDKEGNFKSDSTKQKAEEIEFLREQVCSGVLTEEGDDDVLTKALGKPEHGGRVRGQGMHVRKAVYFNLSRSKKQKTQTTVDEQVKEGVRQLLEEEVNNIVASRDAFWMAKIEKLKSEIWKKQGSNLVIPSQEASCSPKFREGQNQQVAWKNLKDSFDAELEPLTENNDIGDECNHKLSVAEHVDEKQNVKEREKNESEVQEIDTVEKLVEVGGLKVEKKAEKDVFIDVDSGESQMAQLAFGSVDNIVAHAKVYGFSRMDDLTLHGEKLGEEYAKVSITEAIQDVDIPVQFPGEVLTVEQAKGTFVASPKELIVLDVLFLKESLLTDMVGTLACGNIWQRSRKLADRFKGACDGQHFLIPFNDVNHWALTVVKPNEEVVYYMDPLKRRIDSQEWTEVVDNAIVLYKNTMNTPMLKKKVSSENKAGIPMQKGNVDYGLFVMRYMKEICQDKEVQFASKVGKVEGFYKGAPSVSFSSADEETLEAKMHFSAVGRFKGYIPLSMLKDFLLKVGFLYFRIRRISERDILFTFKEEKDYIRLIQRRYWSYLGGMHGLASKLKGLKAVLKEWNLKSFGNIQEKIQDAERLATSAQECFEADQSDFNRANYNKAKAELIMATDNEFTFWKQKANLKWMEEGDSNTKFFHAYVKGRRTKSMIRVIEDSNGKPITNIEVIKKMDIEHFFNQFNNRKSVSMSPILAYITPTITEEDNNLLTMIPSDEEIKNTVWSLSPDSAPGPDGYNGHFFKFCWEIIHKDVISATREFFLGVPVPISYGSTFISLIPKTNDPKNFCDYRPISLSTFMSKINTKILATRLQKILHKVVSVEQTGF